MHRISQSREFSASRLFTEKPGILCLENDSGRYAASFPRIAYPSRPRSITLNRPWLWPGVWTGMHDQIRRYGQDHLLFLAAEKPRYRQRIVLMQWDRPIYPDFSSVEDIELDLIHFLRSDPAAPGRYPWQAARRRSVVQRTPSPGQNSSSFWCLPCASSRFRRLS